MLKSFAVLAVLVASPVAAHAEVLLPSETAPRTCPDGQVYSSAVDGCVTEQTEE